MRNSDLGRCILPSHELTLTLGCLTPYVICRSLVGPKKFARLITSCCNKCNNLICLMGSLFPLTLLHDDISVSFLSQKKLPNSERELEVCCAYNTVLPFQKQHQIYLPCEIAHDPHFILHHGGHGRQRQFRMELHSTS